MVIEEKRRRSFSFLLERGFFVVVVEAAADVLTTIRLRIMDALKTNKTKKKKNTVATVLAIPTGGVSFFLRWQAGTASREKKKKNLKNSLEISLEIL